METIELLKPYTHKSNIWKKGDRPTVGISLAKQLIKDKVAKSADQQAPAEQFRAELPPPEEIEE